MAKEFTVGNANSRAASTNKRFRASYTLNGKKVTTVGMLAKDEQALATYVSRSLANLGIALPADGKITVEPATSR